MRNIGLASSNLNTFSQTAAARTAAGAPTVERLAARKALYLAMLRKLDSAEPGTVDVSDVASALETEFGIAETMPLGLVARCYLGPPYQVHLLDLTGRILEHYDGAQTMPPPFERARALALHGAYAAIEVYAERMVCVRPDGTTAVVNR